MLSAVKKEIPPGYQRLVDVLLEGKENAKTTTEIIKAMGIKDNDKRNVMHIVEQLVTKYGYLIGSSRRGHKGYYIISNDDEYRETLHTYNSQIQSMLNRHRKLQNGYKFTRNDHKQRIFVENDLVVLRHFQNLVKHHNMMLDNAAKLVVDRFGKGAFAVGTGGVPAVIEEEQNDLQRDLMRSNEGIMVTLVEHVKTQDEFNRTLLQRLEQQEIFNCELMQRLEQQQKHTLTNA
jgi:hypothetical protein